MSKNRRATAPILALLVGLVGALALLVGPAAAMDPTASGDAHADNTSVASGSAIAENGSTASGEAVARDGSVASGCSTAIDESTASGATNCPSERHKKAAAPAAKPVSSKLALTGSSSDGFATVAFTALFAGALLVAVATSRRRHTAA